MYALFLRGLGLLSLIGSVFMAFGNVSGELKFVYVLCGLLSFGVWFVAAYALELLEQVAGVRTPDEPRATSIPRDKSWEKRRLGK
jgi:hypothetical protein